MLFIAPRTTASCSLQTLNLIALSCIFPTLLCVPGALRCLGAGFLLSQGMTSNIL
jgi:formate dehydrogenase assembly factor FdhD